MLCFTTASVAAAFALAAVFGLTSCASPPSSGNFLPAQSGPASEAPAPAPSGGAIRLATFNLYNHPWERTARLEATADLFRKLDPSILCLQEVATGFLLPGEPASKLAEELKMRYVRYWHEENWSIFRTGIAVLSKFPILSSEYHDFEAHGFWNYKGYMIVRLGLPDGRTLQLINLHMASTGDQAMRQAEWQELRKVADGLRGGGPVLIVGDFNTGPSNPALQEFVRETGAASIYDGRDVAGFRSWTPEYRDDCGSGSDPEAELIDFMFTLTGTAPGAARLELSGGRIIRPESKPHPSDHCPVTAELRIR